MKRNKETKSMKRPALAASLTACVYLGLAASIVAAQSPKTATENPSPKTNAAANDMPAQNA